jgi:TP901 family phage tail tape measure protein
MAGSLGTISGQVRLDAAQALAAFAALRTASAASAGAMATAGTRMSAFGKVALGAGIAMVAAFGVAINAAADFEKKMDYFGAVNNATAQEMEAVRQKALELGQTSAFSAGQIADAFVEMGKAGVSVTQITGGLAEAVVNMAQAADIDLTQATNIVTSQLQAYSLSAQDAAHVTDVLAGAANASIVDVSDLGVSLKYVGGVAHALGISFDSTIDALSLLGKAGIKGSTAGTSLRQIMVSLAGGTQKATDKLIELGIITKDGTNLFFDAHGKAKSLAEIFQILQDHTAGLSQKEQLMAFRTIFNNRALAAAEILTKAGAKGFAEMNGEISKTTAADVAAKRMDNLSGDVKKLHAAIETLMIKAGTPFQNFLRGIVQGLTHMIQMFARLPAGVQTGILAFIGIAGVALIFMGAFALVGGTILRFLSVFRLTIGAFRLMAATLRIVTAATWAQTTAALANPYVLIAMAVIALIVGLVLLYKRSEKFREIMDAIGRGIKVGFLATVEWFKGLPKWFSGVWKDITNIFKLGVGWVKKNWDLLLTIFLFPVGIIVTLIRRFGDDVIGFFKAIPGAVVGFVTDAAKAVLSFVKNLPYYVGYAFGFVLGTIVKFAIGAYNLLSSWAVSSYNAVVNFFQQLPGRLATFFTQLYNGFITFTVNFINALVSWVTNAYNSTVTWFQKLPGRVAAFLVDMKNRSVAAWNNFLSASQTWLVNTYNAVVTWFQKLPGRVAGFVIDMKNRAVSGLISMYNGAKSWGSSIYHAVADWVSKLPGAVWGAINNAISAFKSMVSSAFGAAKDFARGLWDGFKDGLGINSPSLIEKQMVQITAVTHAETSKLVGQVRMMQGLASNIDNINPAQSTSRLNTTTLTQLTRSMSKQAAILNAAATSMPELSRGITARPALAYAGASSTSGTAQGLSPVTKNINVTVNNPVAERASDSTARKLRQLSDMGAL